MKPTFETLKSNYYSSNELLSNYLNGSTYLCRDEIYINFMGKE